MRNRTKITGALLLAAALLIPAGAAIASTSYSSWSVNLPALQQGTLAGSQPKSLSGSGNINVTSVALDYTLNARMCKVLVADPLLVSCGTERTGLGDASSATLPTTGSSLAVGDTAFLQLHNNTWTAVRVSANGSWRAN